MTSTSTMFALSKKMKITLVSMLVFLIVSSAFMYNLTNTTIARVVGMPTITYAANGGVCPTTYGLLLHTFVFGLITYGLMFVPML